MTDPDIHLASDLILLAVAIIFAVYFVARAVALANRSIDRYADESSPPDDDNWYTRGPRYLSDDAEDARAWRWLAAHDAGHDAAHDAAHDPAYAAQQHAAPADSPAAHVGYAHSALAARRRPSRDRPGRRYPLATVTRGSFAGTRVEVLMRRASSDGEWFVRLPGGAWTVLGVGWFEVDEDPTISGRIG